ncbi:bifunctional riboflavin kinase/FAD synthetase [Teredinibacter waterburyi]|uniref:bifunctional riboflavin kinase/FAD synthetase n=1 Tax=Teredinibacter waterburyi TaxID=1500538 RepID=UPI00165FB805|nr:bifunctional riboflavin kinase/FAD synthetase [Teredinibacter waterburyi]
MTEVLSPAAQPEFIHGLASLQSRHYGCVATIGSFDGVHLGHQKVLAHLRQQAEQLGLPSLVMVFEPQPYEYFSREAAPARLMRLREKVEALFAQGIDRVLCLKFNQQLRTLSAEDYIEKVLVDGLGVKYLVVGDDFRFGCDRSGDFSLLQKAGELHGFAVCDTQTEQDNGERISSTRIRSLLEQDDFASAARLLGRDYQVLGRVIHGRKLGRSIGFPTANIGLGRYRAVVQGVYAVTVRIEGAADQLDAVANVGVRPTIVGGQKPLLEVHLLDRTIDLYSRCIRVKFKHKIRRELRFSDVAELQQQIALDVSAAKAWFATADIPKG